MLADLKNDGIQFSSEDKKGWSSFIKNKIDEEISNYDEVLANTFKKLNELLPTFSPKKKMK